MPLGRCANVYVEAWPDAIKMCISAVALLRQGPRTHPECKLSGREVIVIYSHFYQNVWVCLCVNECAFQFYSAMQQCD